MVTRRIGVTGGLVDCQPLRLVLGRCMQRSRYSTYLIHDDSDTLAALSGVPHYSFD